jgi:hypothetical protein
MHPKQRAHLQRIFAEKERLWQIHGRTYATAQRIVLWDFTILNPVEGSCAVQFDSTSHLERLSWFPSVTGRPDFAYDWQQGFAPAVAGPLRDAIETALASHVPAIKPLGVDRETGRTLTALTPFEWRLPPRGVLRRAYERLTQPGFVIVLNINEE